MKRSKFKVLIDTDPGLGKRFADVDDGLALFVALNNPEIFEIEGITTVFGNTPVKKGFRLLKTYLELVNRKDIPHFMGASSKNDLGKLDSASNFIIKKVKENPKEIILLTLGPLTNIATALEYYPDLLNNLKCMIFMGGTVKPNTALNPKFIDNSGVGKITEFNFYSDAIAAKRIIEAKTFTQRIGMGLDICCQVVFNEEHLEKIISVDKPIPRFINEHIRFWLNLWEYNNSGGFFPFDTLVPIYNLNPELFEKTEVFLEVDTENVPGKISILDGERENSAPITYCMRFNEPNGKEEFMDALISNLIK
jgi:purine nucleosidase